ncbi:MAG: hypothetical protein ACJ0UT_05125, partial [Candidatus Latescibacterota bacterium]
MLDVLESEQVTNDFEPIEQDELELPPEDGLDLEEDSLAEEILEDEEGSFFTSSIFFGILGAIGILAVAGFAYLKMMAGNGEDEEDEE